jgi:hypothetical protein
MRYSLPSLFFPAVALATLALAACTSVATPEDETVQTVVFKTYPQYVGGLGKWLVEIPGHEDVALNDYASFPVLVLEYRGDIPGVPPMAFRMYRAVGTQGDFNGYVAAGNNGGPGFPVHLATAGTWRYSVIADGKAFAKEVELTTPPAEVAETYLPYANDMLIGCGRRILGQYDSPYCNQAKESGWSPSVSWPLAR